MKALLLLAGILFVWMFLNATNNYPGDPVTTGWIFNDTGNCDLTVSA